MQSFELDPDIEDLFPIFVAARQSDLVTIEHSRSQQNYKVIEQIAHTICGSGGSFGFPAISNLGELLHDAARAKDDDEIAALVEHLRAHLAAVEHAVGELRLRLHAKEAQ